METAVSLKSQFSCEKKKINVKKSARVKNNVMFLKYSFDNGTSRFATD
jgi:hypothetical protein